MVVYLPNTTANQFWFAVEVKINLHIITNAPL